MRLHKERPFDVAHHVTLAADYMLCGVSRCRGVAARLGPVGGAQQIPEACRPWLGWPGWLLELARRSLADPLRHAGALRTARRAALVVARNDDAAWFWSDCGIQSTTRPHVFLRDPGDGESPASLGHQLGTPACGVRRRPVAWKGVHLALATIAEPAALGWELHFIESRPEETPAIGRPSSRTRGEGPSSRRAVPSDVLSPAPAGRRTALPEHARFRSLGRRRGARAGCPVVCLRTAGSAERRPRGGGLAIEPTEPLPHRLAEALAIAAASPPIPVRWSAGELSELLPEWYGRATVAVSLREDSWHRWMAPVLALALLAMARPVSSVAASSTGAVNTAPVSPAAVPLHRLPYRFLPMRTRRLS